MGNEMGNNNTSGLKGKAIDQVIDTLFSSEFVEISVFSLLFI
jgi:hypothetical protein